MGSTTAAAGIGGAYARAADTTVAPWLYPALSAAVVAAYWIPRLFRGFWIDEAGAYWIAHAGFTHVWAKLQIYPGQSIIYTHLSAWFVSNGPYKEAILRLPSVAGMLLAAWLLYRLTETMVGQGSGWLAAAPLLCAGSLVETATNARPYALGLAVVLASFFFLRQWVETGARKWLAGYTAASALIVYFHYLFAVVFVVQFIYVLAVRLGGTRFSWSKLMLAWAAIGIAAVPLAWQFLTIVRQSNQWKSAVQPTPAMFLSFYPVHVFIPVALGLLLFRLLYRNWIGRLRPLSRADLVLLVTWLLLGPLLLFGISRRFGFALFATRYLIYALPPFFILLAWCLTQVLNARARFALVLAVALSSALYVPHLHDREWREPLAAARRMAGNSTPILLRSGFVESAALNWKQGPRPDSYLFAPLAAYPLPNEIIPVPFFVDPPAEEWLESEIARRMPAHRRFCLVANSDSDAVSTLPGYFAKAGYRTSRQEVGEMTVAVFDR